MGSHVIRIRKETYELLKAESEKRRISMSELIHEAVKHFLHGNHHNNNKNTIMLLSQIEDLKREIEKIKQFLSRKFGMEFFTSR